MKAGADQQIVNPTPSGLDLRGAFELIKRKLPAYEHRQEQLDLADGIERAIQTGKTGVFEAGTGVGKSLAALIPAVLSGKRVVVSTATISLQDQYISKEIPLLKEILPNPIEVALVKGRNNFIGLRRWQDHLRQELVDDDLIGWVNSTLAGDVSELEFVPPWDLWSEINSDSDDCLRNKCPSFNNCFYFESRRRAEKADLLVVNHALLLADAASHGAVLPQYEVLIIDEAHHLNAIATDTFSASLTSRGIKALATKALKKVNAPVKLVEDVERDAADLFRYLNDELRYLKMRIYKPVEDAMHLKTSLTALKSWLDNETFEDILDVEMAQEKAKLKAKALISNINTYLLCLGQVLEPSPEWVTWVERHDAAAARMSITAAPLDVSEFIHDTVLSRPGLGSAVFMSATLATGGDDPFSYFKKSAGISGKVVQEKLKSPFDYKKQSILYLPKTLPDPNSRDYLYKAAEEIERIIEVTEGRAFVLFTSKFALSTVYDAIGHKLPYQAKKQGDMSRHKLIEWFKSTPNPVLFGTSSFWEGVSIDGEQLSCVIIDRIPFQVPDDPVHEARCDVLKADPERSWFNELSLPYAITRLKQGVGRLIRTQFDYGMVAVLDPRLTQKYYGKKMIECLPPMRLTHSLNDVRQFFDDVTAMKTPTQLTIDCMP